MYNFIVVKGDVGYKIMYKDAPFLPGQDFSFPNADIFPMKLVDNKNPYYTCKYKVARELWPNERYYISELYPLKKYKFGDHYMYA